MIFATENYLLEVEVDNSWGGTLYYLYRKSDLDGKTGLQKPAFSLYSTEIEDDDRQFFNEMEDFIYGDSTSPDKDFREIMLDAVGLTKYRFDQFSS